MGCFDIIKDLCDRKGIAVTVLEKELGFGRGSIGKIKNGGNPSAERLQKIADYFGVSVEYLMTGEEEGKDSYYLDDDAKVISQFIFDNPDFRILVNAAKDVKPENLQLALDILKKLS